MIETFISTSSFIAQEYAKVSQENPIEEVKVAQMEHPTYGSGLLVTTTTIEEMTREVRIIELLKNIVANAS